MGNPEQNSAASTDSESLGNNSVEGNGTLFERIDASILKPSEGLNFESNGDGTCTLIGIGICKDSDVVIPAESPEGEILSSIEKQAFFSLEDVNSVTLLNVSCEVEESAFSYSEITALHIIGGEPVIGQSAFSGCEDLVSVSICENDRTDNVISIEDQAFAYCRDLTTAVIGDGTVKIGDGVFSECAKDLTITIAGQSYMNLS